MNTQKFEKLFDCFKNINVQVNCGLVKTIVVFIITVDNGLDIFGVSNLIPTTFHHLDPLLVFFVVKTEIKHIIF